MLQSRGQWERGANWQDAISDDGNMRNPYSPPPFTSWIFGSKLFSIFLNILVWRNFSVLLPTFPSYTYTLNSPQETCHWVSSYTVTVVKNMYYSRAIWIVNIIPGNMQMSILYIIGYIGTLCPIHFTLSVTRRAISDPPALPSNKPCSRLPIFNSVLSWDCPRSHWFPIPYYNVMNNNTQGWILYSWILLLGDHFAYSHLVW